LREERSDAALRADIEPGLALTSLARFADRIAVTTPDSQKYFSRKVTVTGYPLRMELEGVG